MTTEQQLQDQIAALESTDAENIPAVEVKKLISSVKGMFGNHFGAHHVDEKDLYAELGELARFINTAKKELESSNTGHLAGNEIPDASSHLDAIIQMTEEATDTIMDNCERLQNFHATVRERLMIAEPPIDPDTLAGVDDCLSEAGTSITKIFEACNFQDVTGQRIAKVVTALQEIERHVLRMVVVFGLTNNDDLDAETRKELEHDAELLQGPALKGQGLEQDDIDDLLDKLL